MNQLKLSFNDFEIVKNSSRIRFSPIWKKFYSVYQFNFILYHKICADVAEKTSFIPFALMFPLKIFTFYLIYFCFCSKFTRYDEAKIRKFCYILDDDGAKKYCGDEKHVYRLKTLHKIYEKLFNYAHFSPFATESLVNRLKKTSREYWTLDDTAIICRIKDLNEKGYTVHFDENFGNQLEIKGTELLSIKERLCAHLQLLRKLKKGEKL